MTTKHHIINQTTPTSPPPWPQSIPSLACAGAFAPGQEPVIGGIATVARLKTYNEQPVHLLPDDSGSMSGTKAKEATTAMKTLMSELADPRNKDGFRIDVIRFGSNATLECVAVPPESVNVSITGSSGGTNAAPALELALQYERSFVSRPERRRVPGVVVIMSDGHLGDTARAVRAANELKDAGVTIIAIGFGSDADTATLQRIATSPAHYAFADVGTLVGVFAKVGKTISQQLGKAA